MRPEQKQRLEQIRELRAWRREHADHFHIGALHAAIDDIDFLLSLVKEQEAEIVYVQATNRIIIELESISIEKSSETEICPVCKDEVPAHLMLSYNNVPNAFCQGCVDSGRV